jgi:hypothetical protein
MGLVFLLFVANLEAFCCFLLLFAYLWLFGASVFVVCWWLVGCGVLVTFKLDVCLFLIVKGGRFGGVCGAGFGAG